jgi:hypothetical protein
MRMALRKIRNRLLCTPRGFAAVMLVVAYLFAGFAHSFCGLDVSNPAGATVVSVALDDGGDVVHKGARADHHCHGCFSVAMPSKAEAARLNDLPISKWYTPPVQLTGRAPGLDTPPPKYLA